MSKIRRKGCANTPQPKKETPVSIQKETQMNDSKSPSSYLNNQASIALKALQEGDKTTLDFIYDYHILCPSARISKLRKTYNIITTRLPSRVALYHLEGKIDD